MFVFAHQERDLWVSQLRWFRASQLAGRVRFSRNITELEHSVIQSVMLVQGEPGGVEKFSRDMRVSINITEREREFWTV